MRSVLRMLAECISDSSAPNNSRSRCTGYRTLLESANFPTLEGLTQESFKAAISIAAHRADIRKKEAKDASSVSSEASPGKLKDDKKWQEWITGFKNMLLTLLGVNGVPLLYVIHVIREKEEAEPEGHNMFVQKCIACAPLNGPHFETDARKVHQLATSFTQGETSEQWIKMHVKKQNGRVDLKALCAHYQGAGNTTRRIAEATRLRETLHYKNKRLLSFATFLSKVQHMFNLFEEEDETFTESAKFRFLMEKVQNPQLEADISALKAKSGLGGTSVSFTDAANLIAASVATLPESISKSRISSMNQTDASDGAEFIYRNGKVYTGYYKNFMLCRKLIVIRSWQNANVKASRRVLKRRQVVKSRLPRLLRKNLPLRNVS